MTDRYSQYRKVIITGSRDYEITKQLVNFSVFVCSRASCIVHGNSGNIDLLFDKTAKDMSVDVIPYDAEWKKYNKSAGPIRNAKMLDENLDSIVIGLPNTSSKKNSGTWNCLDLAKERNMETYIYSPENFHHMKIGDLAIYIDGPFAKKTVRKYMMILNEPAQDKKSKFFNVNIDESKSFSLFLKIYS